MSNTVEPEVLREESIEAELISCVCVLPKQTANSKAGNTLEFRGASAPLPPSPLEGPVVSCPLAFLARALPVAAFVVARPGPVPTLDDLCAALDEQGIARYKWPERLILIDALPRNPLGKIQRNELAVRAAAEVDRY